MDCMLDLALSGTPPGAVCRPSGEARADVGVPLPAFRGIKLGLGCATRGGSCLSVGASSWLVVEGSEVGIGGACIMDNRFKRRVSVGLMVRAPRPDIRPDAMDCRLLPEEEGVCARRLLPFDIGRELGVLTSGSCSDTAKAFLACFGA